MAIFLEWVAVRTAKIRTDIPLALLDALLVAAAFFAALVIVLEGVQHTQVPALWRFGIIAVAVHLAANGISGLYGQVWRQAGVQEARRLVLAGGSAGAVLLVVVLMSPAKFEIPIAAVVLGNVMALLLVGGVRFQSRLFAVRRQGEDAAESIRLAVIGAGNAGGAVVREMLGDPGLGLRPVAILDDNRELWGRELSGVPIIGGLDDLPDATKAHGAQQALLAIPSAGSGYVGRAFEVARAAGIDLRVLPSVPELVGGTVSARDVRDLSINDLLGRKQIATDLGAVARILEGRRVLITGAGGSIGSEIARQVATFGPSGLLLLDHDETHLHDVASDLDFPAQQVLADIRDLEWMRQLVAELGPEVIFHAAAHKHVPLLESYPCEAIITNVVATENLLQAAADVGVERFVFISTDKSVRPSSVMGATKHVGEQLLLHLRPRSARFCAVRFGNVLASRGSVIPMFVRQIQRGGPVTVTDPEVTRFFMSIPEAVQLVLQAAALSEGGEVFMLDMGEPLRILDLATRMIHLSGRSVGSEMPITFTGLRPGEKLTEELRSPDEPAIPTAHPAVMSVQPILADRIRLLDGIRMLAGHAREHDPEAATETLFGLVPGGARQGSGAGETAGGGVVQASRMTA